MMGPVQVLVVGFDRPSFSGEVLAELTRLREAGIVRLVDLLLVSRTQDGAFETVVAPDGQADLGGLAAALLGRPEDEANGEFDMPDGETEELAAWSLADVIPPGSAAAVALIEHIWAQPLTAALKRAGASRVEETWLAPGDVEELEAMIAHRDR